MSIVGVIEIVAGIIVLIKPKIRSRSAEIKIIDKVIKGDIDVFEVLRKKYNPYLYKVRRSYHSNHEDVEDLLQETFINAYANFDKLENRVYFKTW